MVAAAGAEPAPEPDEPDEEAPPEAAPKSRVRVTTSVVEAMQAVQDGVRLHPFVITADLDRHKLARTLEKLRARLPDLERDYNFAARRRKAGKASHLLIGYWPPAKHTGFFVLLSSAAQDGSGEAYRDVRERKTRLTIRADWWELVRYTDRGVAVPRWTWQMHPDREARLRASITRAARKRHDRYLAELGVTASRWPGFHGVRKAHKRLGKHLAAEWKRARRADEPAPVWRTLPYTRRRARAVDHAHETGGDRRRRAEATGRGRA